MSATITRFGVARASSSACQRVIFLCYRSAICSPLPRISYTARICYEERVMRFVMSNSRKILQRKTVTVNLSIESSLKLAFSVSLVEVFLATVSFGSWNDYPRSLMLTVSTILLLKFIVNYTTPRFIIHHLLLWI